MITWEGLLVYVESSRSSCPLLNFHSLFAINFANGGYAGSFWGLRVVWLGTLCTYSTMAELASMCV